MRIKRSKLNKLIETLLLEEEEIDFDAKQKGVNRNARKEKRKARKNADEITFGGKQASKLTPEEIKKIQVEDPAEILQNLTKPSNPIANALYITMKDVFNNKAVIDAETEIREKMNNDSNLKELYEQIVDIKLNIFNLLLLRPPNTNQAKLEITELDRIIEELPDAGMKSIQGNTPKAVLQQAIKKVLEYFKAPEKAKKTMFDMYQDIATSLDGFSISQYLNKMKTAKVQDFNFSALAESASRAFILAGKSFKAGGPDAERLTVLRLKVVYFCVKEFPEDNAKQNALHVISQLIILAGGSLPDKNSNNAQKDAEKIDKVLSQENPDDTIDQISGMSDEEKEALKKNIDGDNVGASKESLTSKVKSFQKSIGMGDETSGDWDADKTNESWRTWLNNNEDYLIQLAKNSGVIGPINESLNYFIYESLNNRSLQLIIEMTEEEFKQRIQNAGNDATQLLALFKDKYGTKLAGLQNLVIATNDLAKNDLDNKNDDVNYDNDAIETLEIYLKACKKYGIPLWDNIEYKHVLFYNNLIDSFIDDAKNNNTKRFSTLIEENNTIDDVIDNIEAYMTANYFLLSGLDQDMAFKREAWNEESQRYDSLSFNFNGITKQVSNINNLDKSKLARDSNVLSFGTVYNNLSDYLNANLKNKFIKYTRQHNNQYIILVADNNRLKDFSYQNGKLIYDGPSSLGSSGNVSIKGFQEKSDHIYYGGDDIIGGDDMINIMINKIES